MLLPLGIAATSLSLHGCGGGTLATTPHGAEPGTTKELLARADEAEDRRDHLEARRLYEQAIREASGVQSKALATREWASTLLFWGEYEEAEQRLEECVALQPTQASAWHDLGILRSYRGDEPGAAKALQMAVRVAPSAPKPRIALAAHFMKQKQYKKAKEQYEVLLSLSIPPKLASAAKRALSLLEQELTRKP